MSASLSSKGFIVYVLLLIVVLCLPLYRWFVFCLGDDLHSYALLVPVISLYLIWPKWKDMEDTFKRDLSYGSVFLFSGTLCLAATLLFFSPAARNHQSALSLSTFGVVLLVWGLAVASLGCSAIKRLLFPFVFLLAMVPLPPALESAIASGLQHASAEMVYLMFSATGMTMARDDLIFTLPGISLEIAPECSGIHSTIVLFVTSLVGGYLMLRSPWKRTVLCLAVLPLAILRNGFRVWVLGELCVHVDPEIINSSLHHRGGPIFFVLSLLPFSALVYGLWRSENKSGRPLASDGSRTQDPLHS